MVCLTRHCEGKLGKSLEACYMLLGVFGWEGPESSDLLHGIGFGKPSPIPTWSPSAIASARARLLRIGGMDRGVVGMAAMRGASQARLVWAALVILMTGQEGSDTLIHVWPVGLAMRGRSDLQWTGLLPHSITLELRGMLSPIASRTKTALESRQWRNRGHILGAIE